MMAKNQWATSKAAARAARTTAQKTAGLFSVRGDCDPVLRTFPELHEDEVGSGEVPASENLWKPRDNLL